MSNLEKRLLGKNTLVTGAGDGIGKQIALRFAKEGSNVAVNDINAENARKTASEIEELGQKSIVLVADVSKKQQVKKMVKDYFSEFDRLDVLVNNAGIGATFISLIHLKEKDWDRTIDINLKGVWLVTKYFVKKMKRNKVPRDQLRGKVINLSSMAGRRGRSGLGAYCASKFGVVGLTQTFARELGRSRITVNAICPGLIDTNIYGNISKEGLAGSSDPVSLKYKPVGDPDDVANVAFFLASSDSDYISGQCIGVSGGMYFI
ncbi:MAG: glucose 1-dehydrogenase [Candidatus Lokiarchaeota archaeon]|nr:glucose 1-dehydrogenase [Candidatus Lokiarchaeota archaeon]